ncbi:MAG TPA: glycosyltransferase 87 family protein [Anaerolineaceae bacterium]
MIEQFFSGRYFRVGLLITGRLLLLLSMPIEGLKGYGDLTHYFNLAELPGFAYIHFWSEYPPFFSFFTELIYLLSGGKEHIFLYLLYMFLIGVDAANLRIFEKLADQILPGSTQNALKWLYFLFLSTLAYGWWYFDPLVVLCLLLGLYLMLERRPISAGIVLGIGVLLKFFPILAIPAGFRYLSRRQLVSLTAAVIGVVFAVYLVLFLISPKYTLSSLGSQGAKGSWETIWALLDGNYRTGSFGALTDRFQPETAFLTKGNPAIVPPILSLVIFGLLGVFSLSRWHGSPVSRLIGITGFTWVLFFLWSPGWSPQWSLYLIPLILLGLPGKESVLLAIVFVLVNLLEWPLLLSRGRFDLLPLTIGIRTLLLFLMGWLFYARNRK